jgi:hypothetical protein
MLGNRIERNGGCGVFYCLRTKHSLCESNFISENSRDGISVGERDTDHILRGNTITANGGAGIHLREPLRQSGDRLWIEGNHLKGNSRSTGLAEIFIANDLHDVTLIHNDIQTQDTPALAIGPGCTNIVVFDNEADGRPLDAAHIVAQSAPGFVLSPQFPSVGPAAAGVTSGQHLGVARLEPLPR